MTTKETVSDIYFDYGEPTLAEQRYLHHTLEYVVVAGRNPQVLHIPNDPDATDRDGGTPACDGRYGGGFGRTRRSPTSAYPWNDEDGPFYPYCQKCVYLWRDGDIDV